MRQHERRIWRRTASRGRKKIGAGAVWLLGAAILLYGFWVYNGLVGLLDPRILWVWALPLIVGLYCIRAGWVFTKQRPIVLEMDATGITVGQSPALAWTHIAGMQIGVTKKAQALVIHQSGGPEKQNVSALWHSAHRSQLRITDIAETPDDLLTLIQEAATAGGVTFIRQDASAHYGLIKSSDTGT